MDMLIQNHQKMVSQLMAQGETQLKEMNLFPFAEEIAQQREESKRRTDPAIMFYGLYNAGKSTLINALCKKNVAKVGDVPTTASIQQIPWSGYVLTDTPGINAKDEHTEIATAEVDRSDLVLFVMDNMDGFERDIVYQVIVEILKRDKALAIILNQKSINDQEDSNLCVSNLPSMNKISKKILGNLNACGKRNGMDLIGRSKNFLGIFLINANTALDANEYAGTEVGDLLYANSGINSLVNAMNGSIAASKNIRMLQTPLVFLKTKLTQALEDYRNSMDVDACDGLAKERKLLAESKQRASDSALDEGLRKIDACFEQVRSAAASGQPYDSIIKQMESDISSILSKIADKEVRLLQEELQAIDVSSSKTTAQGGENDSTELLDVGIAIGEVIAPIPVIVGHPEVTLFVQAVVTIMKGLKSLLGDKNTTTTTEDEARKSSDQMAAYYKWLNELRDYEAATKSNYKSGIDRAISDFYNPRIAELDERMESANQNFVIYNTNVKQVESIIYRAGEEIAELSLAL